jgi:excisionase family DNA binding protein
MCRKAWGVSATLPTVTSLQTPLERLKRALEVHRQALDGLETALLEFEEALAGEASERPESAKGLDLLSIPQVCQELGMGKSWVYKHIRGGEIPSIKLGHNIKVRRAVLEEYLQRQAYRPQKEAQEEEDEPPEGDDHPLP